MVSSKMSRLQSSCSFVIISGGAILMTLRYKGTGLTSAMDGCHDRDKDTWTFHMRVGVLHENPHTSGLDFLISSINGVGKISKAGKDL